MADNTVIAIYRPKPGQEAVLSKLVASHHPQLLSWGFATARVPVILRSPKDGTYLEIFEWISAEAVERAHTDARVKDMWAAFAKACDYGTLGGLAEAKELFPHFELVSPKG